MHIKVQSLCNIDCGPEKSLLVEVSHKTSKRFYENKGRRIYFFFGAAFFAGFLAAGFFGCWLLGCWLGCLLWGFSLLCCWFLGLFGRLYLLYFLCLWLLWLLYLLLLGFLNLRLIFLAKLVASLNLDESLFLDSLFEGLADEGA